ncbi:glycoside hydrolase [Ceratobasidium sp. AG-I]|nr:glycoside hydrolase [Ceratobasidium sp. AG-I]
MLLALAAIPWLVATGVAGSDPLCSKNPSDVKNRRDYFKWAKDCGMCKKFSWEDNPKRQLAVPPDDVLADFDVCVAKNEFGEALQDNSGKIFCYGKTIHLMADARNHNDSKTFVDRASTLDGDTFNTTLHHFLGRKDSRGGLTVQSFLEHVNGTNSPYGLTDPGVELNLYKNTRFPNTPAFISQIRPQARLLQAWIKIIHHYWNNLDRTMDQTYGKNKYLLPGPGSVVRKGKKVTEEYSSTLIRLEHPFVIAGGRFREQYYWDAFFVIEGLLAADMSYLARTTLLNFMDQIKAYGFIANGGRKYYLNRSQPPLFIHMLHAYVDKTKDTHILHEALPLAERELRWWSEHRSVEVKQDKKTHTVYRYYVKGTGPRPESYAEDWRSVWCYGKSAPKPQTARDFYSEFASGAESGWDYTVRWTSDPGQQVGRPVEEQMRHLRIRSIIPVDLNSIIYRCHELMAELYRMARDNESPFHNAYVERHESKAKDLRQAILALHWDSENLAFFDYVLDGHAAQTGKIHKFWSVASLAPYWVGIQHGDLNCTTEASRNKTMQAFSGVRDILSRYPGPIPATLVESKQQWDFPNAWPPLQYIAIKAIQNIDEKCMQGTTARGFATAKRPEHHLGELPLPDEIHTTPKIDYTTSPSWRDVLLKTVAMRYINAAYCTWNEEGKLPSDRVERIVRDDSIRDENLSSHPGRMFEKLNAKSPVEAGGGGEYKVQTGFGWTNGVAIWIAHQFGDILDNPNCNVPSTHSSTVDPNLGSPLLFQP